MYLLSDVTQAHASGKAPVLTEKILSELPAELLKKLCHVTVMLYRAAKDGGCQCGQGNFAADRYRVARKRQAVRKMKEAI